MSRFLYLRREEPLPYQNAIFSRMWTNAFLRLIGEQVETAELIVGQPFVVEELHERTIGEAKEDFWLKQYEDYDFHNPGGESLNQVRTRMKMAVDSIRLPDGGRRNCARGFSCNGNLCIFAFLL